MNVNMIDLDYANALGGWLKNRQKEWYPTPSIYQQPESLRKYLSNGKAGKFELMQGIRAYHRKIAAIKTWDYVPPLQHAGSGPSLNVGIQYQMVTFNMYPTSIHNQGR
jgi:hypothetical protein